MANSSKARNENLRLRTKILLSTVGMSQKRFAEQIGYDKTTISAWLNNKLDLSDKGITLIEYFLKKYDLVIEQMQK